MLNKMKTILSLSSIALGAISTAQAGVYVGVAGNMEKNEYSLKSGNGIQMNFINQNEANYHQNNVKAFQAEYDIATSNVINIQNEIQNSENLLIELRAETTAFKEKYGTTSQITLISQGLVEEANYIANINYLLREEVKKVEEYKKELVGLEIPLEEAREALEIAKQDLNMIMQGTNKEIELKESASKNTLSASISAGYVHTFHNNFIVGGELSATFGDSRMGSGKENEIKTVSKFGSAAVVKIGYKLDKGFITYMNTGVAMKNQKASFEIANIFDGSVESSNSTSKVVSYSVVGFGAEQMATNNIGIFTEVNFLNSMKKMKFEVVEGQNKKLSFKTQEVKIGARYYFN